MPQDPITQTANRVRPGVSAGLRSQERLVQGDLRGIRNSGLVSDRLRFRIAEQERKLMPTTGWHPQLRSRTAAEYLESERE